MAVRHPTTFASLLRRHRLELGLTQQQLADRAQLSVRGLRALENGTRTSPYPHTVHSLADALELNGQERRRFEAAARSVASPRLQLVASVDAEEAEPTATHRLPWQPTPFIGRAGEVAAIKGLLARREIRLFTLIGPGGTGKTRLALAVGEELQEEYGDGVCFVSLAALRDSALIPAAIAQALGVAERGRGSMAEVVLTYLRPRNILLLLDNFEQVREGALWLPELLEACRHVDVLVTSRIPLRLTAEQRYPVPPLRLPTVEEQHDLTRLAANEAVQLFVCRAQAVQPAFRLTGSNAGVVAEICRRLEGLPLAIELAAARLVVLSPAALLVRLERRLPLLASELHDVPARQQTLRATLDWSYSLLTAEQQILLARLSVFAGGATLDPIETVCNAPGDLDVLTGMTALVEQSLARRKGEDVPRFLLLETIREYAAEQLSARQEADAIWKAHADWCLTLAEQAAPELLGPQQGIWLAQLDGEVDNLRAALSWLRERGHVDEALRLAIALSTYWYRRGYWSEGVAWLETALALDASGSSPVAAPSPLTRCQALVRLGRFLLYRGAYERAAPVLQDALALAQRFGADQERAWALSHLGWVMYHRGDVSPALELMEESLRLQRAVEDRRGLALTLDRLGSIAVEAGDFAQAEARKREALALYREMGDVSGIADSLNNVGYTLIAQGKFAAASPLLEESLALVRRHGFKDALAYVLDSLGAVARAQGKPEQAASLYAEALQVSHELGDTREVLYILGHLVELAATQGQMERSVRLAGAEAAGRDTAGIPNVALEQERREKAMSRARQQLGDEAFDRAWAAGRAMGLEDAISYSLLAG